MGHFQQNPRLVERASVAECLDMVTRVVHADFDVPFRPVPLRVEFERGVGDDELRQEGLPVTSGAIQKPSRGSSRP
jgi:hypothetical protein